MNSASANDGWLRNPGHRLAYVEGRHVFVRLRNGFAPAESWAAGRFAGDGCRWSLTGDAWDIEWFKLAA